MIVMIKRKEKDFLIFLIVSFVALFITSSLKYGSFFGFNTFMTLLIVNFCYNSCLYFDMV